MPEFYTPERMSVRAQQLARLGLVAVLIASGCAQQQENEQTPQLGAPIEQNIDRNGFFKGVKPAEEFNELTNQEERLADATFTSRNQERQAQDPACWIPEVSQLANTESKFLPNIETACEVARKHYDASEFNEKWRCFVYAMDYESGFNDKATNEIGAGGIPQALPASKMGNGWYGNPKQQLEWAVNVYIKDRYNDNPCQARQHQINYGWY